MTTESDDGTTNGRLNTDWPTVQRVIDETTAYSGPGAEPWPDVASIAMLRRSDLYDHGSRLAYVNVPAEDMATAREFEIRYIEAFDQILPDLGAGEWAAIRRAWEDME